MIEKRYVKKPGRPLILLIMAYLLSTCIDPFNPELNGSGSLLVVDALVTNENRYYQVRLSRTSDVQNEEPSMVTGAQVSISENTGKKFVLQETTAGIYRTDSMLFRGEIGNSYILSVKTTGGDEYESDLCTMYPVHSIENVYFSKDQGITNNGSEIHEGIRIFIDSGTDDNNKYLRWVYNEYWKISVPDPKKYNYINDSTIVEVDQIKQVCWGNSISDDILIYSNDLEQTNSVERKPIVFIASEESDRLLIQYCVEIKQLSLSRPEFEFWNHLKQVTESGGDIFEKQPFPIVSNIHNINNPKEQVLGFFQVSAVDVKRLYITPEDIADLNIPLYQYNCERITVGPGDFPPPLVPTQKMTFDKIYKLYFGPDYDFIEPVFDSQGELQRLVFSRPVCSDCTLNGSLNKPDFWVDIKENQLPE
jgi:hypothetical protein